MIQQKFYKCNNKSCSNYNQVESKIFDTELDYKEIKEILECNICGETLQIDLDKTFGKAKFNIDEIALGTKRFWSRDK